MADEVQKILERSIPELEDLLERGLFEEHEIRSITDRRRDYEYRLQRREKLKVDFMRYIQYENSLETLRVMRKKRMKLQKETISDFACVRRVQFIYDRALNKFQTDASLWMECLDHAIANKSAKRISRLFPRALQMLPRNVDLWLKAADWEYRGNQSYSSARILLSRALRLNKGDLRLYRELFKLEINYVMLLKERRRILGLEDLTAVGMDEGSPTLMIPTLPEEPLEKTPKNFSSSTQDAQKKLLQGAIAIIVFKSAMKEVKEDSRLIFCLECLALASEKEVPTVIPTTIVEHCKGMYDGEEAFWNARAEWHMLQASQSAATPAGNIVDATKYGKRGRKRSQDGADAATDALMLTHEERAIKIFEEAVNTLPTPRMFEYYLDFLSAVASSRGPSEQERVYLMAHEHNGLKLHFYERWVRVVFSANDITTNRGGKKKKQRSGDGKASSPRRTPLWIATEAVQRFPLEADSWELLLNVKMVALKSVSGSAVVEGTKGVLDTFETATGAISPTSDGAARVELLWLQFLDALGKTLDELRLHTFGRLASKSPSVKTKLAVFSAFAEAMFESRGAGTVHVLRLFREVEEAHCFLVIPWEVYHVTILAELSWPSLQNNHSAKKLRELFEKAILRHASELSLWLLYMKFETSPKLGDLKRSNMVAWRAKQNLPNSGAFDEAWTREELQRESGSQQSVQTCNFQK